MLTAVALLLSVAQLGCMDGVHVCQNQLYAKTHNWLGGGVQWKGLATLGGAKTNVNILPNSACAACVWRLESEILKLKTHHKCAKRFSYANPASTCSSCRVNSKMRCGTGQSRTESWWHCPTFFGLPVCCDTAHSSICIHCITSLCCWSPCEERRDTKAKPLRQISGRRSRPRLADWLHWRRALPETVCDGSVLLHIHWQIKEVLIFTAHLPEQEVMACD